MPGVEPCQNNFPATLAHQKKGAPTCSATENQSCGHSAGRALVTKPFVRDPANPRDPARGKLVGDKGLEPLTPSV